MSSTWKLIHGLNLMLGGLCLVGGSAMYFPKLIEIYDLAHSTGGWLLSIGSSFLLIGDIQEWINNNRKYRLVSEQHQSRCSMEIISLFSACGSANYVLGSILLIPNFDKYVLYGNYLILIGSTIIFISSIIKINRNHSMVDLFSCFGALGYFSGVTLLIPYFVINSFRLNLSASLCVFGGFCFFISSLFLQYSYFY